ncbi:hypothetical protein C9374_001494 [Naegleria lovaniensis]|uniref:Zn(2)-C6 fungal-type domain-containing protein n=1 Tax=Naegleria lovaniensis TaxID=51637 RepID=A0AA88KRA2_NAELO|nr:uncharacterized protein C9374_001494 [Naegleria lovaniensis]KAG2387162.1 hypothetical protein C9374_001494 [Naegleria lovaniensis]
MMRNEQQQPLSDPPILWNQKHAAVVHSQMNGMNQETQFQPFNHPQQPTPNGLHLPPPPVLNKNHHHPQTSTTTEFVGDHQHTEEKETQAYLPRPVRTAAVATNTMNSTSSSLLLPVVVTPTSSHGSHANTTPTSVTGLGSNNIHNNGNHLTPTTMNSSSFSNPPFSLGNGVQQNSQDMAEQAKKRRRNQAKAACENCRKAHTACQDQKPCHRCVKLGLECVEAQKKTKMKIPKTSGTSPAYAPLSTTTTASIAATNAVHNHHSLSNGSAAMGMNGHVNHHHVDQRQPMETQQLSPNGRPISSSSSTSSSTSDGDGETQRNFNPVPVQFHSSPTAQSNGSMVNHVESSTNSPMRVVASTMQHQQPRNAQSNSSTVTSYYSSQSPPQTNTCAQPYTPVDNNNNLDMPLHISQLSPQFIVQFQQQVKDGNCDKLRATCEHCFQLITMSIEDIKKAFTVPHLSRQHHDVQFNSNRNGFLLAYLYGKFNVMNMMRDMLWTHHKKDYIDFLYKLVSLEDDKALIRMFLQGVQLDLNTIENENGVGLLSFCACFGRLDIFKMLCEEFSCSLYQCRDEKYLPIHFACSYGHVEIAEYILQKHPDQLDIQMNNHSSPLILSSAYGSMKSVKFLVERGANVHLQDHEGQSAVYHATKYNHFQIVQYLAQHNADLYAKTNSGQSIFDLAEGSPEKKLLLELIIQNKTLNDRISLQDDLIKSMRQTCK